MKLFRVWIPGKPESEQQIMAYTLEAAKVKYASEHKCKVQEVMGAPIG